MMDLSFALNPSLVSEVYDGFSFANLQECYSTALIQSRLMRDPLKDPTNHDACLLPLRIPGTQPLNFCPFCS